MALMPYALTRPFLFALDPETAHHLALKALSHGARTPLQGLWRNTRVKDPITIAGMELPNRVGLAAGIDKDACAIDAFDSMGLGFLEVGTLTPKPQSGNPRPRLFRLPQAHALINRMGFNNEGMQAALDRIGRSRWWRNKSEQPRALSMKLGINIGKNATTPIEQAVQDYLTCLTLAYPCADYITLNISSPNTKDLRTLQAGASLHELLKAVSTRRSHLAQEHGKDVPLFLKIAPDLQPTQIQEIAQALIDYRFSGVIATNTTLDHTRVLDMEHGQEGGGLSGGPVRQMSSQVISQLRGALGPDFAIIGVGGIFSGEDAMDKLQAGANAVQICTGFIYEGPELISRVASALAGH